MFRSDQHADTYLYLPEAADFEHLPEKLQQHFGEPAFVLHLNLDAETKLAQADALQVITSIQQEGYFLQLPPNLYTNLHNPWA